MYHRNNINRYPIFYTETIHLNSDPILNKHALSNINEWILGFSICEFGNSS